MPSVLRLLAFGVLIFVQPEQGHPIFASEEWIPEEIEGPPRNHFVTNSDQLCRPFVSSDNPQVVRVISLVGFPGPNDTVKVQVQTCTGVVIGPRLVLTAKHCLEISAGEPGKHITGFVRTFNGDLYVIRLQSPDPHEDLMVLLVDENMGISPARIAPKDQVSPLLSLHGYGCLQETSSLMEPNLLTALPLKRSAATRRIVGNRLFMTGCVCHGDSGGPVFDDAGRLVALMVRTDNRGMAGGGLLVHDFLNAP